MNASVLSLFKPAPKVATPKIVSDIKAVELINAFHRNDVDPFTVVPERLAKLEPSQALGLASSLSRYRHDTDFCLGGVLHGINQNEWWAPEYASFEECVRDRCGFGLRQAQHLMRGYSYLTEHHVSWTVVQPLGWTRLRRLVNAEILTADNAVELTAEYSKMTVKELENELKFVSQATQQSASAAIDAVTGAAASTAPGVFAPSLVTPEHDTGDHASIHDVPEPSPTRERVAEWLTNVGRAEAVALINEIYPGSAH